MARARQRERWEHTSLLCAVVATYAGFGCKKERKPSEFNPLRKPARLSPKESVAYLASVGKSLNKEKRKRHGHR
jgi:hypothetical protein